MTHKQQTHMTQEQHFYAAHRRIADRNNLVMELIRDPHNPMTNADLTALIARHPDRYGHLAGLVGKLPH